MVKVLYLSALMIIVAACQRQLHFPTEPDVFKLKADRTSLRFPDRILASDSFSIESNLQWSITVSPSSVNWFSLDKTAGTGNVKVYANLNLSNFSDSSLKATITISAVDHPSLAPVIISVTQDKRTLDNENAFGGTAFDEFNAAVKTPDGGYIAVGYTDSKNGDVSGVHGSSQDAWVVKFDAQHRIMWQRAIGGTQRDYASSIVAAHGSGYIICANVRSTDGDVANNHGATDAWVIKMDDNGNTIWKRCLGGTKDEVCPSIVKSSDGGYVLAGTSGSNDGDVSGNKGMGDAWIIKIDGSGWKVWQKTFGGSGIDEFLSVTATPDGGYLAAGLSQSTDGDISGNHGSQGIYDALTVKFDANGNVLWNKMYGGTGHDRAHSVVATPEGTFLIAGTTESSNGDFTGNHGSSDGFLMKINANGDILRQQSFGGSQSESVYNILITADNYYVLAGTTQSSELDPVNYKGNLDGWILKLSTNGDFVGLKLFGGSGHDKANWLLEKTAGEYVLIGGTYSNDKDIIGAASDSEAWFMKFNL